MSIFFFFFFQAEDGIRDLTVTGVQTCALPILAEELRQQLARRLPVPVIDPGQGIRATVLGASQYTVQVSGKTIYLPDPGVLLVHGAPVVSIGLDMSGNIDPHAVSDAITMALKRVDLTAR